MLLSEVGVHCVQDIKAFIHAPSGGIETRTLEDFFDILFERGIRNGFVAEANAVGVDTRESTKSPNRALCILYLLYKVTEGCVPVQL